MLNEERVSKLIGEILLEEGLITPGQLQKALDIQKEKKDYLCSIIIELGYAKPHNVFQVLSRQLNIDYVDLKKETIDAKAVAKVPAKIAIHYKLMPYNFKDNKLCIALSDPLDIHKLDDLKLLLDNDIKPSLSYEDDILEAIQKHYGVGAEILEDIMARSDIDQKIKPKRSNIEDLETVVEDASI